MGAGQSRQRSSGPLPHLPPARYTASTAQGEFKQSAYYYRTKERTVTSMERRFLCRQCQYVFDTAISGSPSSGSDIHCPACRSADVTEAPPWAPLGSGLNIFESDTWEYECQQCQHKFKMPIPRSPAEDRGRRCPLCDSGHLHLLTGKKALPLYCG